MRRVLNQTSLFLSTTLILWSCNSKECWINSDRGHRKHLLSE
jgi:hypothetical protein